MGRIGLWLRVVIALLVAVLPPVVGVIAVLALERPVVESANPALLAAMLLFGVFVWVAILAVMFARLIGDEIRSVVSVVRHGGPTGEVVPSEDHRRLAQSLDERNRQVSTLAEEVGAVPIDVAPRLVVASLVSATQSVMGDPTWRAAVLTSEDRTLLPPGIYLGSDEQRAPEPIGALEQWAATGDAGGPVAVREGPWGAFAIVSAPSSERLTAVLYAPWEGRIEPSASERAILALVGQHFTAAVEHALLYARVRTQADELDRLAKVQADFLRGVTHDLQTPLTSIGALAAELKANASVPADAGADLDTIIHQADRLRRMVSQLLVASRLEAGVLTPRVEIFAVRPIVERTWQALRADRPFEVAEHGPRHLAVGDPDRMEQVLWALLDNAVKYSPPGSPIGVEIAAGDGAILTTVRDRGAGMDAEASARAFEQFYRSEEARRSAPDGSGVGLYAARGLVESMGGSIRLSSALGHGTSIGIALSAEPSEEGD